MNQVPVINVAPPKGLTTARSPLDHYVSGTIASGVVAGGISYHQYKNNTITKKEAVRRTVKLSAQGGLAAGSSISTANYIAQKRYLSAAMSLALGIGSVLAIEKIFESDALMACANNATENETHTEESE